METEVTQEFMFGSKGTLIIQPTKQTWGLSYGSYRVLMVSRLLMLCIWVWMFPPHSVALESKKQYEARVSRVRILG